MVKHYLLDDTSMEDGFTPTLITLSWKSFPLCVSHVLSHTLPDSYTKVEDIYFFLEEVGQVKLFNRCDCSPCLRLLLTWCNQVHDELYYCITFRDSERGSGWLIGFILASFCPGMDRLKRNKYFLLWDCIFFIFLFLVINDKISRSSGLELNRMAQNHLHTVVTKSHFEYEKIQSIYWNFIYHFPGTVQNTRNEKWRGV